MNAFAAFDDDDSGQVDVADLKDAVANTAPDAGVRTMTGRDVEIAIEGYVGRRAFGRSHNMGGLPGMKGLGGAMGSAAQRKGDVFRYAEFVGSIMGGSNGNGNAQVERIQA